MKTAGAQPAPVIQPAPGAAAPAVPVALPASAAPAIGAAPTTAPAADVAGASGVADLAERPFETVSGGIALRYPAGSKALREPGTNNLVEFRQEQRHWSLVVSRQTYPRPMYLTAARDSRGTIHPGILEETAAAIAKQYADPELLKKGMPGVRMLRQDMTNLGKHDVGMLAFRYTKDTIRYLAQSAIVEDNDQVFYVVSLTTPARTEPVIPLTPDGEEASEDPGERQAVDTFRAILESVRLLDRTAIREEQVQRLLHTRALLLNWTTKALDDVLLPDQYMRVLKLDAAGKPNDVGWRYIVEQPEAKGNRDGIRVGIHTCFCEAGPLAPTAKAPRVEMEAWMSVSADRKLEDWSSQTVLNNGSEPTPKNPWPKLVEFGTSDFKTTRFLLANAHDREHPEDMFKVGTNNDPQQPWVGTRDSYTLNVQYVGTMGNQDPVSRLLPVFYLPQALDSMLPRLLPPNEPKKYMLATYVSDAREVMTRYVEVGQLQNCEMLSQKFQAIPITDHVGWEGSVTTHYVTPTGKYIGCENKDTHIVVVPTDKETLTKIWPDAQLRSPGNLGTAPMPVAADPWAPRPGIRPGAPGAGRPAAGRDRGSIQVGPTVPPDLDTPDRVLPGPGAPRGVPNPLGTDPVGADPLRGNPLGTNPLGTNSILPERVTPAPRDARDGKTGK